MDADPTTTEVRGLASEITFDLIINLMSEITNDFKSKYINGSIGLSV